MILLTSNRWTALDLDYKEVAEIDLFGCLAQASFPRLQELKIIGDRSGLSRPLSDRRRLLEVPNLRSLTINDGNFNFMSPGAGASSLTIPSYTTVQDVHLMDCEESTWLSLFQAMQSGLFPATSYVKISVLNEGDQMEFPASFSLPGQQNNIAQLKHLHLHFGYFQDYIGDADDVNGRSFWRTLMASFHFPNLGTLTLPASIVFDALRKLEPERIPNLHYLSIQSGTFNPAGKYLEPLSSFTSLRHLIICKTELLAFDDDPSQNVELPPLITVTIE